jgi:type II secretory pathway component PulF
MPDPHENPSDSPPPSSTGKLSQRESVELSSRIAELSAAKLPLAPGLRVAAAELPDGKLAATMKRVGAALESGQSPEDALSAESRHLPSDLAALIRVGVRKGDLGRVMSDYVRLRRTLDDVRRSAWLAVAYPGLLIIGAAALCFFFFAEVIPTMSSVAKRSIPDLTYYYSPPAPPPALGSAVDACQWLARNVSVVAFASAAIAIAALVGALVVGPRRRRRFVNRIPLFGAVWRNSGLIEANELLWTMLQSGVPLPEALRLTAGGIRDADVAFAIRGVAARVEGGMPLAVAIEPFPQFPRIWQPILAWGDRRSELSAALNAVAELDMRRLELRARWITTIVPPAIFLALTAIFVFIMGLIGEVLWPFLFWTMSFRVFRASSTGWPEWPMPSLSGSASLLLVGGAILVSLRLIYSELRPLPDGLQHLMRLAGRLMVAFGILGLLAVFTYGIGEIIWIAALGCCAIGLFRFRQAQQLTMLNLLAVSAERNMPLEPAVRALANEEGGVFYSRATSLGDSLMAGTPLSQAIDRNRRALPPGSSLAAKIGESTGDLGAALRTIDPRQNPSPAVGGNPPIRTMSIVILVAAAGFILPYLASEIVPRMQRVFSEFHQPVPPLTAYVFDLCDSPWIEFVSAIALTAAAVAGLYASLRAMGWLPFELPPASRIFAPRHSAVVLRLLALSVERGQPFGATLDLLASAYPAQLIRKRARSAAARIARGKSWAPALRSAKLVGRTDAAILEAAANAGNLPWAMREAADNAVRRLNYRLSMLARTLFPLLILAAGAAVMLFVVGWFLPLIDLLSSVGQRTR